MPIKIEEATTKINLRLWTEDVIKLHYLANVMNLNYNCIARALLHEILTKPEIEVTALLEKVGPIARRKRVRQ